MTLSDYNRWFGMARRCSRREEEAGDLLQDALLAALRAGRLDLADEGNRRWLTGVIRKIGTMTARTEVRRRERESRVGMGDPSEMPRPADGSLPGLLDALPPSARKVALLALHGLNRVEIEYLLGISPTAFRQRLTTIRKVLGTLPEDVRREAMALAYHPLNRGNPDLDLGLIRRALLLHLRARPGIGTHDPDGHLIVVNVGESGTSWSPGRLGE
jgi:RNA polymerase sigma-70 factor (ECF subfamily)